MNVMGVLKKASSSRSLKVDHPNPGDASPILARQLSDMMQGSQLVVPSDVKVTEVVHGKDGKPKDGMVPLAVLMGKVYRTAPDAVFALLDPELLAEVPVPLHTSPTLQQELRSSRSLQIGTFRKRIQTKLFKVFN